MYDGLQQCWELPCLHESYNGLHPIPSGMAHEATARHNDVTDSASDGLGSTICSVHSVAL